MSRITQFSISGLAGRKENYIKQLNPDVNIFFGLNGRGKTSLLKILHSALSEDPEILHYVPFKDAEVKAYSHQQDKEFTCVIEQSNDDKPKKDNLSLGEILDFSISDEISEEMRRIIRKQVGNKEIKWTVKPQRPKWHGLRHTYLPISRLYVTSIPVRYPKLTKEQLDLLFARHLQGLWTRHSTETLSAIRKAQEEGLSNILKAILSSSQNPSEQFNGASQYSIDPDAAYERVTRFLNRQKAPKILGSLEEFKKRYQDEPQIRSIVGDIDEIERNIEQSLKPREDLEKLMQQMFADKNIHFTDQTIDIKTNEEIELGLHSLSSGEKQLMLLLIETLLAGESCIIIDEPELSMHIDWQRQLVNVMQQINPKAQIIMATHSPEIMADVNSDKIFRI